MNVPLDRFGSQMASPLRDGRGRGQRDFAWLGVCLIVLASIGALYGIFWLDVPIARFVRSLQHPLGYLTDPWLEQVSWLGDWLGGGPQLVVLSVVLWVIGRAGGWNALQRAGVQSLLAHAVVALITNAIKRALGRPRPKFSHAGEIQLWPSFDNGFDSFPSGHASATFAIATVLATRFPCVRWLWYGVASLVACSRVLRGAHFPTDVLVGAVLGVVVGWVLSHPLVEWRRSLVDALNKVGPWMLGVYSVLWVASHPLDEGSLATSCFVGGVILTVVGMVGRVVERQPFLFSGVVLDRRGWDFFIGGGLLMATAAPPLWMLGGMMLAGRWWSRPMSDQPGSTPPGARQSWRVMSEAMFAAGLLLSLAALRELPGLFPIR